MRAITPKHIACAFTLSVSLTLPAVASAQENVAPISTERPSAGVSADLLPAGSLQTESGIGFTVQSSQSSLDLPEQILRFGFSSHLELRFTSSSLTLRQTGPDALGSTDSAAGVKVLLGSNNSFAPRSAVLGLSFPTGTADLTSGTFDPTIALVWNQAFGSRTNLTEVAQATVTTSGDTRKAVWSPGISVGRALSRRFSTFLEYAPTRSADDTFAHLVDAGFLYAPTPFRQFDFRIGVSTSASAPQTVISFGYSRRFDHIFGLALVRPHPSL